MSITIAEMRKEFERRHDFESTELDVLRERFANTFFGDIPEAWIVPIDETLTRLYSDPFRVRAVDQRYGFLVVTFRDGREVSAEHRKIVKTLEQRLYDIDRDLHDSLSANG